MSLIVLVLWHIFCTFFDHRTIKMSIKLIIEKFQNLNVKNSLKPRETLFNNWVHVFFSTLLCLIKTQP